jgi:hypothetical protein
VTGDHHAALGGPGRAELRRRRDDLAAAATGAAAVSVGELCGADDLDAAVAALAGALAPGERLAFLEHIGRVGVAGRVQALAGPLWSRLGGGCHVDRDVPAALRRGGFLVTDLERFTMPTSVAVLRPWVQGTAVRVELPA